MDKQQLVQQLDAELTLYKAFAELINERYGLFVGIQRIRAKLKYGYYENGVKDFHALQLTKLKKAMQYIDERAIPDALIELNVTLKPLETIPLWLRGIVK